MDGISEICFKTNMEGKERVEGGVQERVLGMNVIKVHIFICMYKTIITKSIILYNSYRLIK
jgi:hypothetical protein